MGQVNKISELAISLPFSISPYGTIAVTSDQNKIWADRVLSVLGTGINERIMFPQFGSKLYSGFFNGSQAGTDSATEIIKTAISEAFITFLPLLTLTAVNTSFNTDEATLSVEVVYQLPDQTLTSTSIGRLTTHGNLLPIQEN